MGGNNFTVVEVVWVKFYMLFDIVRDLFVTSDYKSWRKRQDGFVELSFDIEDWIFVKLWTIKINS